MRGGFAELVVFTLGGWMLALPLRSVRRVVRAARITPVPGAPHFVSGLIDIQGEALAVVDMRLRLGLPARPLAPEDQFVIARTERRSLALVVDEVRDVAALPVSDLPPADLQGPGGETLQGLARMPNGLALIQDLERLLTPEDAQRLDAAMEAAS